MLTLPPYKFIENSTFETRNSKNLLKFRHGADGWMSIIDTHNHFRLV